jgi:hypothetical protein
MHFNPDKCKFICITTKWNQRIVPYYIHGEELAVTTKAKYLMVNISNNLSWNHHIDRFVGRQTALSFSLMLKKKPEKS